MAVKTNIIKACFLHDYVLGMNIAEVTKKCAWQLEMMQLQNVLIKGGAANLVL